MNLHTPSHSHDGNIFGSTKLIPTKEAVLWKCSCKINNFYSHYNMLQDTNHPACQFSDSSWDHNRYTYCADIPAEHDR